MNPQRLAFKEYFMNPESETFGVIKDSAIRAGFSKSYAAAMLSESTGNAWVKELIKDYKLVSQAEHNLEEMTAPEYQDGKIKADLSKFILKNLKKEKYSERQEVVGKDGKDLIPDDTTQAKVNEAIDNYFKNAKSD